MLLSYQSIIMLATENNNKERTNVYLIKVFFDRLTLSRLWFDFQTSGLCFFPVSLIVITKYKVKLTANIRQYLKGLNYLQRFFEDERRFFELNNINNGSVAMYLFVY